MTFLTSKGKGLADGRCSLGKFRGQPSVIRNRLFDSLMTLASERDLSMLPEIFLPPLLPSQRIYKPEVKTGSENGLWCKTVNSVFTSVS